jgi:hypothetical protein
MPERLTQPGPFKGFSGVFENARDARKTIDSGINKKANFVDQSLFQKQAIGNAAFLKKESLDAEDFQCTVQSFALAPAKR